MLPEDPFTIQLLFAVLIGFVAGAVRGYAGFGSGMVMAPLLTLMWGPVGAISVLNIVGVVGSSPLAFSCLKNANWRDLRPILLTGVIFVPIGGVMLVLIDPDIVTRIIAVAILGAALLQLTGWRYTGPRGVIPSGIAGSISGWIDGISTVGGPVAVIYFIALPDGPRVQRANITLTVYSHGVLLFLTLVVAGTFSVTTVIWASLILPPFLLGVYSGARLFQFFSEKLFRWIVLGLLIGLSLLILVR